MIRRLIGMLVAGALGLSLGLAARAAESLQCPPDAVASGTICIDAYEASVWQVPSTNTRGSPHGGRGADLATGRANDA